MIILTGNQRIHPGLSDLLGPRGDLFCHGLRREKQKSNFPHFAENSTDVMVRFDTQNHLSVERFLELDLTSNPSVSPHLAI